MSWCVVKSMKVFGMPADSGWLGQLHHCLQHREIFDESYAYLETSQTPYEPTTDSQALMFNGLATWKSGQQFAR